MSFPAGSQVYLRLALGIVAEIPADRPDWSEKPGPAAAGNAQNFIITLKVYYVPVLMFYKIHRQNLLYNGSIDIFFLIRSSIFLFTEYNQISE